MKKILRQVIGNYVMNSPLLPIPKFIICFLMKPMFSIFALAISSDCLFLDIFQTFFNL